MPPVHVCGMRYLPFGTELAYAPALALINQPHRQANGRQIYVCDSHVPESLKFSRRTSNLVTSNQSTGSSAVFLIIWRTRRLEEMTKDYAVRLRCPCGDED